MSDESMIHEEPVESETVAETETKETDSSSSLTDKLPYHERYYLRYCNGKRSSALDLEGTKSFLQAIGFDGGELRQAREGKNRAEDLSHLISDKNNQMYCSYCGSEISGVEFYRMPDGRLRCNTCSSTVIKTKEEAEAAAKAGKAVMLVTKYGEVYTYYAKEKIPGTNEYAQMFVMPITKAATGKRRSVIYLRADNALLRKSETPFTAVAENPLIIKTGDTESSYDGSAHI